MSKPACKTCKYWERSCLEQADIKGTCRYSPPTVSERVTAWPRTYEHEWCARYWKKREE